MTKRVALLRLPILLGMILTVAACGTRSISNSGYEADPGHSSYGAGNPFYRGELSEFDVLGAAGTVAITDEDIRKSFAARRPLAIAKGSPVMLVQSGAIFPDDPMLKSLAAYYPVVGFSGIPEQAAYDPSKCANPLPPYAMALRLLAAKGGYEKIVVYCARNRARELGDKGGVVDPHHRQRHSGPEPAHAHPPEGRDHRREVGPMGDLRAPARRVRRDQCR